MLKLTRLYNQNRKGIWLGALIVAFFIIVLQLINWIAGKQDQQQIDYNQLIANSIVKNENNITIESKKSSVSGEKVNTDVLKKSTDLIKEFINYCREDKIEEAYDMLTEECKGEICPSIGDFNQIYYSQLFQDKNGNFSIENWHGNTYRVRMSKEEDMLATGKINDNSAVQDYITIKKQENDYKLNINNYIGRSEIQKKQVKEQFTVTVVQRDTYMDYEKYTIKIKNNTKEDILLDTMRNNRSMYIEDESEVKYGAYNHELATADLNITAGNEKMLTIKYYSSYNSNKRIKALVFSDVIFNYDSTKSAFRNYEISQIKVAL